MRPEGFNADKPLGFGVLFPFVVFLGFVYQWAGHGWRFEKLPFVNNAGIASSAQFSHQPFLKFGFGHGVVGIVCHILCLVRVLLKIVKLVSRTFSINPFVKEQLRDTAFLWV